MIVTILKLGIFMLSNLGYWEFFRNKCKLNVCFLPAFTIAVQFTALYLGGLLNLLGLTSYGLYALGLVLLLDGLRREKLGLLKPYLNWGYAFLAAATGLILIGVKGEVFAHYDNFSHWAIVVKNMLSTGRFPNFMDGTILFQSYPLGSAAYIYYFCKLTYAGESMQMLAQAFLMLSMILPWFGYVEKKHPAGAVLAVLMANFLLCYNVEIYDLLVDTLLPLTGMAALLFIYQEYLTNPDRGEYNVYYCIPFLVLLSQIKNSGIFFVLLAAALLVFTVRRKEDLIPHGIVFVSPFAAMYLWNRHCDYAFAQAATSKHSIAVENYATVFYEKTTEDIRRLLEGVLEHAVSRQEVYLLLGWLLVLGVLTFLIRGRKWKGYAALVGISLGLYAVYTLGLVGMYVFSMPLAEAFGSMERYMKTIDIAVYYLLVCYGLSLLREPKGRKITGVVLTATMVLCWYLHFGGFAHVLQQNNQESLEYREDRTVLEAVLEEYEVPPCSSYFLCIPEYSSYEYFLCQYLMDSNVINNPKVTEASQLDNAQEYAYMVILETGNPIIEEWVQAHYPDQVGKQVICME